MLFHHLMADTPLPYNTWSKANMLPTNLSSRLKQSRGMAESHYEVMDWQDLLNVGERVKTVTAKVASLALWTTGPHTFDTKELADAWGFPYFSTKLFSWVKLNKNANEEVASSEDVRVGIGYWTRANTEDVFLFTNNEEYAEKLKLSRLWGMTFAELEEALAEYSEEEKSCYLFFNKKTQKPKRAAKDVRQVIVSPIKEHSRKPDEANRRYTRLMGKPGPDHQYLELFGRRLFPDYCVLGNEVDGLDINESLERLAALDLDYVPASLLDIIKPASSVEEADMGMRPYQEQNPQDRQQLKLAI